MNDNTPLDKKTAARFQNIAAISLIAARRLEGGQIVYSPEDLEAVVTRTWDPSLNPKENCDRALRAYIGGSA